MTVQFKYYQTEQPHAVQDENSHLFLTLKEKMSDKIVNKYIIYLDSDYHEAPLKRTVSYTSEKVGEDHFQTSRGQNY